MPTIYWKKIGKGSWINLGGTLGLIPDEKVSGKGLPTGRRLRTLVFSNFFEDQNAINRTISTLRNIAPGSLAVHPFNAF